MLINWICHTKSESDLFLYQKSLKPVKITFWICVLVLWIRKEYCLVKKLVWNFRIKQFNPICWRREVIFFFQCCFLVIKFQLLLKDSFFNQNIYYSNFSIRIFFRRGWRQGLHSLFLPLLLFCIRGKYRGKLNAL